MLKKTVILLCLYFVWVPRICAQPRFSIATHPEALRSLRSGQKFWAFGHNTQVEFHLTPRDGIYVSFGYYTGGKFKNQLPAMAKSFLTVPQQIEYINNAKLRLRHFSTGWKKFLKGSSEEEENWSLCGMGGFGLLFGNISNAHSEEIDTAKYDIPVLSGTANFKRLTYDLGLGIEVPMKGDLYLYAEGKIAVPAWGYPSNYLLVNDKAPLTVTAGAGVRILF